jgi:hypothetical protein
MCSIDLEMPELYQEARPKVRKEHRCDERQRTIAVGEVYKHVRGKWYGNVTTYKTCAYCCAASRWLYSVCDGYPLGDMFGDTLEHWWEYKLLSLGRLVIGFRRQWRGISPEQITQWGDDVRTT